MARSPAQSPKEKSGSPISRSDPKRGGLELASDEMVLSGCYTKKDHGLKRARQDSEPRVWKYQPMSPDDCQEAYDYTPTGTGATTRYVARYGGFALRTSFRSFPGCQYQEEKNFKRARQDIEHRLDDKTIENEINSFECSPTTCTEYWPYSSELSPSSPPYSPSWSYSPRSSGTPPYVPGFWSYSPVSPNHCQEAQGTGSTIRARQDSEPRVWKYQPMSPDDCQEAYDYTPTGTGATTRYVARYGGFALRTSFRSFTGCQYQEEKKFKRARQDIEHRLDDKTVENEINSLECSPTTCTEYWPYSSELSPSSPPYSPSWSYSPRSSGTPPYVPGCWSYSPASPNHCQEAQGTGSTIRDSEQTINEKGAEGEIKSPEYFPTSYGLRSPENWPESPMTPPFCPNWLPNSP